ncbi:MAG: hypothetical protein R3314_03465 [Longimicrobiales bacterium]|nr:hypothetical protein [Longimicrobiales bacterium]
MSVSLLAAAALVAGIFFSRSRTPTAVELEPEADPGDAIQLEALRRAGI